MTHSVDGDDNRKMAQVGFNCVPNCISWLDYNDIITLTNTGSVGLEVSAI